MGKKRNHDHSPSREKKKKVFAERLRGMVTNINRKNKKRKRCETSIGKLPVYLSGYRSSSPHRRDRSRTRHRKNGERRRSSDRRGRSPENRYDISRSRRSRSSSRHTRRSERSRSDHSRRSERSHSREIGQGSQQLPQESEEEREEFPIRTRKNDEVEIDTEQLPAGALGAESTAPVDREQHASVTATDNENQPDHEVDLGEDVLNVIGPRLEPDQKQAPALHKDIVIRWKEIFKKGISNEENKNLVKKYNIPKNCGFIAAPVLNSEVIAAIQENVKTRDKRITEKQERIAACMAANGKAISITLKSDSPDKLERLEIESDIGRLLAFLQREESEIRQSLILANLNSSVREILTGSTVDGFLFGENLEEKIKTAETIERASKDLYV
ncbi:uncharacterized protein LOC124302028 [Neodiprion virginianus]|uniref:uncharacterized protein LOC124302028 n=1 Tax=Neodiprion virginianus TaxID=2961670 RepID=UPI001EE7435A|nr:uncharacterized protein LOC124302028 [Neodiprion virginianus]